MQKHNHTEWLSYFEQRGECNHAYHHVTNLASPRLNVRRERAPGEAWKESPSPALTVGLVIPSSEFMLLQSVWVK